MKRAGFFRRITAGAIGSVLLQKQALAIISDFAAMTEQLYIGSYTNSQQEGISIGRFDAETGKIQLVEVCKGVDNPSFLIYDNARKFVYAVNETAGFGGKNSGSVSAFRRDETTGQLIFLNTQSSEGAHPCHLTIDRQGKFILVANYSGGSIAVLPILADGTLGEAVEKVQHSGSSVNVARQKAAHAHSINLSPDNRFAFVCDLGIDRIMIYRFDENTGKLTPGEFPFFATAPGAGPRHFAFSKDGGYAFVVNELDSTLTYLKYDPLQGKLTELHTHSTLSAGFTGENTCADVKVHPNNRFVYVSNRGLDSIVVFEVDPSSGKLQFVQHQPVLGKTPRNFTIHHTGRYLLAANQNTNDIHSFSIDPATGKLAQTGHSLSITKPVCLLL